MSTDVSSVTKHFPSAENGFTTTTAGSVSSGAATVTLNSVAGYTNGETVVLVIDPTDATKKQTFTGVVDTAGVQITGVVWTAGTNQTHALGATVVDYATATHISMVTKGLLRDHNQSGYHKTLNDDNGNEWIKQTSTASAVNEVTIANAATGTNPVISATGGDTNVGLTLTPKGTGAIKATSNYDAWVSGLTAPSTVTANGNRSYDLVINSTDYTDRLSPGMRLKLTRTVTAPTGSITLNGTTQYANKTSPSGMTFTDDFVVSAWVKLTSYAGNTAIASRYNGTSGWIFFINSSGQVALQGFNAGAGNNSNVISYQSVPLNKWVHVSAQLDMSTFTATTTTSYIMIDGVNAPASVARAGTNPTALVQAGNLEIGSYNGGSNFFPGQIAQVAIYSAKVTQATILASMNQTLTGSETSLVSAYKLDQASGLNDLSANANNLTAQGSPTYSTTQTPFTQDVTGTSVTAGTTNYATIISASFSTNTTIVVKVPENEVIPTSGGISAVSYSTQQTPYGFPTSDIIRANYIYNPYKFHAKFAVAYTIGAAPALIPFDSKQYDTNNNLDITTNKGRYTVPVNGFYYFNACVYVNTQTAQTSLAFYVNGTSRMEGMVSFTSAGVNMAVPISGVLQLIAGDYVELYYQNGTSKVLGTGTNTYFQGFLISQA